MAESANPDVPVVVIRTRSAPKPYEPALGPVLRVLLWLIFAGVAALGATGVYLLAITFLNQVDPDHLYTTPFTFWMIIGHTGIGVVGLVPFLVFGFWHLGTAYRRPNRLAVKLGILLLVLGIIVAVSGLALVQLDGFPQLPTGGLTRNLVYFAHVLVPVAAIWAYVAHRKAGPPIQWKYGKVWAAAVGIFTLAMAGLHFLDPRTIGKEGPKEGMQYFFPSEMRTSDGKFISEKSLMMDEYCMTCHQDVYQDHLHSAHKFSSFNNPAYLFSVVETRKVAMERDGKMNASRWCAGCHDIVPFASGKFDDPNYDIFNDPTAHAGITCVVCHSITHIHSPIGNAAFTLEEAQHYPFAFSEDASLQWLNNQLIKAKPEFHKKTFLKPFHKSAEFCSTCHKVHLPVELNHYKDFLRGQNHYDSFILSGMGHGSRSFYFPPDGKKDNCATCHMELQPSQDFGAKDFDGSGERKRHSHFFPGSNTGLPALLKQEPRYAPRSDALDQWIAKEAAFLKDKKVRIDLFGLKQFENGGSVDDSTLTVLRPQLPALEPGKTYLIEVVIRTLDIGHHFTQGTADSNEVWVDFHAKSGGRTFGRNGALANPEEETGAVDERAHFVNVHMLDRHGNRIDRRNPQDIFTPLYDKQIPPGAGQVVHYRLEVPADVSGPIELTVRLRFRKFDEKYLEYIYRKDRQQPIPRLPIVDMCSDTVTLPVAGGTNTVPAQTSPIQPAWQRWNDYGIGCLLEGGPLNPKRGNLRQAETAFQQLLTLDATAHWHGHVNLARVYLEQGRLREAKEQLALAGQAKPVAPWWVLAWFQGLVTAQDATEAAHFDTAIRYFETIVDPAQQPRHDDGRPKFDFTKDAVVLTELGKTLYRRGLIEDDGSASQQQFLARAIAAYDRALAVDPEELDAHYGVSQCYAQLAARVDAPPGDALPGMDACEALAREVSDTRLPLPERQAKALALAQGVEAIGRMAPDPKTPKLPVLRGLITQIRAAYQQETDEGMRSHLAQVLANLHLVSHALYKPDELARSRATAEYRKNHPAANAAAEAIVIYPTTASPRQP